MRRSPALAAALVFAALFTLFTLARQETLWGDGHLLVVWLGNGRWAYYHLAYLPAGELVQHTLGALLGWEPAQSLAFLSAASAALAGALVFAAARTLGLRAAPSLLGVLLLVSATSVSFFATAIELHAPQLAAAAGVVLAAVRSWKAGRLGEERVRPALYLVLVAGTHLSGLGWTPALGLLAGWGAWRGGARARALAGAGLCVAVGLALALVARQFQLGARHLDLGARVLFEGWSARIAARELVAPAAGLLALFACVAVAALRRPGAWRTAPIAVTGALFLAYLPFAFTVDIDEHGAYFVSLLPVAALWVAWALARLELRTALAVALLAAAGQGVEAWRARTSWEGRALLPWVATLKEETGERALVFTLDRTSADQVFRGSLMMAVALQPGDPERDPGIPANLARALGIVERNRGAGARIVLLREVYASEDAGVRELVRRIESALGPPAPGRDPAYLLFPPG